MGDSGSMLLGLMLAAASTSASGRVQPGLYGSRDLLALLSPLIVVGAVVFIPLLDLLLAVVRRTRAGRSPFSPDKMHLHHRLLEIGHSHRRAVLLIYLWAGVLAFGAVARHAVRPVDRRRGRWGPVCCWPCWPRRYPGFVTRDPGSRRPGSRHPENHADPARPAMSPIPDPQTPRRHPSSPRSPS